MSFEAWLFAGLLVWSIWFFFKGRHLRRERPAAKEAPRQVNREETRMTTYSIPLVGEQHYQRAIRTLGEGDAVEIVHEPDNPYDAKALAVRTMDDRTIGYLTRDCFIRELVHDEGKGCRATVESIEEDERGEGFLHVAIAAGKCAVPVATRAYKPAR